MARDGLTRVSGSLGGLVASDGLTKAPIHSSPSPC